MIQGPPELLALQAMLGSSLDFRGGGIALVDSLRGVSAAYHLIVGKDHRRRDGTSVGDLVDAFGPFIIAAALVVVLILMAWGCHSGTS